MDEVNQDELRALRHRAYGRDSDIHRDPASLQRLRDLESALIEPAPQIPDETTEMDPEPSEPEPDAEEEAPPPPPRWRPMAIRLGRWVTGLRRSTVLIILGVALAAATLLTVLTLIQRVQTDPLQADATQVARLSLDNGYEIPGFFRPAGTGTVDDASAYQGFHGLRAVVSTGPPFFVAGENDCLAVYPEANITATANSFSGPLFSGCAAGDFPAIVQFTLETDELPEDLVSVFPAATGLQFVYDAEHDEVVVFSDQSG